jgi:hypothetical protein
MMIIYKLCALKIVKSKELIKMNESKKILPMKFPPITSYPYQANLLSVILNDDKAIPWYFNNFIQLEGPKFNDNGMRIDFYTSLLWKTCPWIYYQRISRELVSVGWTNIIEFVKNAIDLGFYAYFNVNTYFISAYSSYKKYHGMHDIFVYGYDNNRLYVADNFKNGKYSYETIIYNELEEGYYNINLTCGGSLKGETDWLNGIELISFRHKYGYSFNVELVKDDLVDYLFSRNSRKKYWVKSDLYWKEKCIYGIEVYNVIKNYVSEVIQGKLDYDLRPFHVLYEHKHVMLSRINYMVDNGYLDNSVYIYDNYGEIVNKCKVIESLWLKAQITGNKNTLVFLTRDFFRKLPSLPVHEMTSIMTIKL